MRFDARLVPRRRLSIRGLSFALLAVTIFVGTAAAVIQLYIREKAVSKEDAEILGRRLFYEMVPGQSISITADDVTDRLIASLVVRNVSPRTDIHMKLEWFDRKGKSLAVSGWRRPIVEKVTPIGADSLEKYLMPGGTSLAGPRNMTLRREDFPLGTDRVSFTLLEPLNVSVFVRFYSRIPIQVGASHLESALLETREKRLEARTALPSSLAPQELIDRLTGWKWQTVAGFGTPDPRSTHLFRRDVQPTDIVAPEEGDEVDPQRTPGLTVGPGKPLSFDVEQPGNYELRVLASGTGDVEIEKRVPGRLPESARVRLAPGKTVWKEALAAPMTVVLRKTAGGQAEVRMVYAPGGGSSELWVAPAAAPALTWLIGPLDRIAKLRVAASGLGVAGRFWSAPAEGAAEAPGSDVIRFEWSPGAAAEGATVKLRVRGIVKLGEPLPESVPIRYRIIGAGKLAISEERVDVPLLPTDLERVPEGWATAREGLPEVPGALPPPPPMALTGGGDLLIEIPDEARLLEIRADEPALVLPMHTLPALRPVLQVPVETPDRTLCYVDEAPPDDARVWHYLRPTNESELRQAGAAIIGDLPNPPVKAPIRGATSADTLWDREAAMPRRHAGSALALWPARPRGAISRNRLFPWNAPWPESAYRPLDPREPAVATLYEPGLPDPADLLVKRDDGTYDREPWVEGPWPDRARWINRPRRDDPTPDPRFAALLRRAWKALPDVPAEFEVSHDGIETWVSLNAQFEGAKTAPLDIDIVAPPWASRRRAVTGTRTEPRRRVVGADAIGERAIFVDADPELAGCTIQTRVHLGSDLPAGDYILVVHPVAGAAWLSMGVSHLGGRAINNGTVWTWRTEGLGGKRLGVEAPGRDPSRDLIFEALVPGRGPARLALEPLLDHWTVAIPSDCAALRCRVGSAGPGPISITLERYGAPKPLPLPIAEIRDDWRQMLPAIDDTYRNPGKGEEVARFRLMWEAQDEGVVPPSEFVQASIGLAGGKRSPVVLPIKWVRDPRTFDADRPKSVLWTSKPLEMAIPAGGTDAAVRAWSERFWIAWERKAGPAAHVAIHTPGSLDNFPYTVFLSRTRRATGLWDSEPRPDYLWPSRATWTTPWEYSDGISREVPELPLVPVDLTLLGATEQIELSRPAAWRKPGNKPGPLWRSLPLGADSPAVVGDALSRAKFGSLRLSFEGVAIEGARAATVEVLVDGVLAMSETLFRARGELSIPNLPAGRHNVLVRPGPDVPAYRCGKWMVRTVDIPAEGDRQISAVWQSPGDGEVLVQADLPQEGEQLVLEVLASRRRIPEWGAWTVDWEGLFEINGKPTWLPAASERHWVAPTAGNQSVRTGADGAVWIPIFKMAWEMDRFAGAKQIRGKLRGGVVKGDAVHLYRMALESGDLQDVDEVRKK